jgi:hypothetical protein
VAVITGYPEVWKIQQAYETPRQVPLDWTTSWEIEKEWKRNNRVFGPNRASPFSPPFKSGDFIHFNTPAVQTAMRQQFQSWVVAGTREDSFSFPPDRVTSYPGAVNFETLRIPLYVARNALISYWIAFSRDCWAATGQHHSFAGCEAQLGDYVLDAAERKASTKSYPTLAVATKAMFIARAIDAARHFHEATRELPRYFSPGKWQGTDIGFTHLELDDVSPDLLDRIRRLDHDMNTAVYRVRAQFLAVPPLSP